MFPVSGFTVAQFLDTDFFASQERKLGAISILETKQQIGFEHNGNEA